MIIDEVTHALHPTGNTALPKLKLSTLDYAISLARRRSMTIRPQRQSRGHPEGWWGWHYRPALCE